jgi:hypothetical protein
MHKTKNSGRDVGPQLDAFKRFTEAEVNCCIAFVQLTTADRHMVESLLEHQAQRHAAFADDSYGWEPRAKDDLRICYLQLREIAKGMATAWRRWASELLKGYPSQFDCSVAIRSLLKQLDYCLRWVVGVGRQQQLAEQSRQPLTRHQ